MKISILGCGWLGLPLAEQLLNQGHSINGSTTTPEKLTLLEEKRISSYLVNLNPSISTNELGDFFQSDLLILNLPPKRDHSDVKEFYLEQINTVIEQMKKSPINHVIFVSSTSVYPNNNSIVGEPDAIPGKAASEVGNTLLKAEQLLLSQENFDTTIVRFGGLYGGDRHPAKHLAGRKNIKNGNAPINLIHLEDCIGIIQTFIETGLKKIKGEIFNGVSDGHPPKYMYYPAVAKSMGLEPPTYDKDEKKNYKIVSNRKLKEVLGYKFKYPNPMDLLAIK